MLIMMIISLIKNLLFYIINIRFLLNPYVNLLYPVIIRQNSTYFTLFDYLYLLKNLMLTNLGNINMFNLLLL